MSSNIFRSKLFWIIIVLVIVFVGSFFVRNVDNKQDKEIRALMEQYAEYWTNDDVEGMKSLHIEGAKLITIGKKDETCIGTKVAKIEDITPKPERLKGFLRDELPPGLAVRYFITFEYEFTHTTKYPLKIPREIEFIRETESSPFLIKGERFDK